MVPMGFRTWGKIAEHSIVENFLTTPFSERLINQVNLTSDFTRNIFKHKKRSILSQL